MIFFRKRLKNNSNMFMNNRTFIIKAIFYRSPCFVIVIRSSFNRIWFLQLCLLAMNVNNGIFQHCLSCQSNELASQRYLDKNTNPHNNLKYWKLYFRKSHTRESLVCTGKLLEVLGNACASVLSKYSRVFWYWYIKEKYGFSKFVRVWNCCCNKESLSVIERSWFSSNSIRD